MKTHRLIEIIGGTIGLIGFTGATMNCTSDDAGPATCDEAKSAYGVSVDGPQILYVGGNKKMPWSAYCVDMDTKTPVEYLDLDTHDGNANFSEFSEGFGSAAFKVKTLFRKVRIDPVNLTINSADKKYITRTPTGAAPKSAALSRPVEYMPYAAALTCGAVSEAGRATASVDLSNTPFEVATEPCPLIGDNTVTHDDSPTQMFNFISVGAGGGSGGTMLCGRASLNCLPEAPVNGDVGKQGMIQLRYIGYGTGSQRP